MPATLSTYDQDLVRWGLHLLDGGDSFFGKGNEDRSVHNYADSPEATGTPETSGSPDRPVVGTHDYPLINLSPVEVHNNVANDEAIALVLQEELTKLAEQEARARRDTGESANENTRPSRLGQEDWQAHRPFNSSGGATNNYGARFETESEEQSCGGQEQNGMKADFQSLSAENVGEMGPKKYGASSSPTTKATPSSPDYDLYQHGDDDENLNRALALSEDEYRYHEEVAKRLTKVDTRKHVPKINAEVMPTLDDASVDHARLMERLVLYGLNERTVQGDGNCQFRALSDQLYHSPEHHKFVRKSIVHRLKARPDVYSGYVPLAYDEYLKKMAKSGEWGDHVTLQAAADSYGVKIWLITSFKDTSSIEILPEMSLSNRVIHLSFWAEVHYNSIYPEGDTSASYQLAPKKRHWLLKF